MEDWQINVAAQTAQHSSGLQIAFEGRPQSRHFSGTPTKVPKDMPSLQLVRLIREGYQAYENAFPDIQPEQYQPVDPPKKSARPEDGPTVKVRRRRPRRRVVE